jgi:hypothetical protein
MFTPISAPRSPQDDGVSSPVLLEDAILKRPGSTPGTMDDRLSGGQALKRRDDVVHENTIVNSDDLEGAPQQNQSQTREPQPREPMVFTWPSLSNIGNVQGHMPNGIRSVSAPGSVSDMVTGMSTEAGGGDASKTGG